MDSMKRMLRVAVLECDTVMNEILVKYGNYGDIWEKYLLSALQRLDLGEGQVELQISKWDVVHAQEYPKPENLDGIVVSGSKHSCASDQPWILKLVDFVRATYESRSIPIVGICFGHQIVARALGAQVSTNEHGWEVAVDRIDLNEVGSKLFGKKSITIQQMHRDIVFDLPSELQNWGSSPVCEIQGLYIPNRVFGVQAHPEFIGDMMSVVLEKRHKMGIFSDQLYHSGMSRVYLDHDGLLVAEVICKFLLGRLP